jgi:hypothetical protein
VTAWLINFAVAFYADRAAQAFAPLLWPALFAAAALLVIAFICRPGCARLWKVAGVVGFIAIGGQVVRLIPNALADGLDVHDWSRWATLCLWAGAAGAWWAWWHGDVGAYHELRRYGFDEVS